MISIGSKFVGQTKMWTLMNKNREMINIPYRPFLDVVFPKGKAVPIIYEKTEKGRMAYSLDMKAVYEEIYEEDCEFDFKCAAQLTDQKTFRKYLLLTDDYGFSFKLFSNAKQDIKCIGGVITCKVVAVNEDGLKLESIHQENTTVTRATESQIKLFNKLHDSRVDDFKVFNKKSYRGYFNSLKDKYPDSAHFIYELLQNADDAKATSVSILLNHDSLIFKHNGTVHFSISDVDLEADEDYDNKKGHINSITGIGDSSKLGDEKENKIGKFGVGFKSVFQYTEAPEIYDDFFHFKIVNYIIPEALDHDNDQRDEGETLIYIPFIDPKSAYDDIIKKLRKLANATLFLNHMKNISWEDITTKESKKYFKIPQKSFKKGDIHARKYLVSEYDSTRYLWMFTRGIPIDGYGTHNISVGIYLTENGTIDMEETPNVFCFFPTSESFQTCMLTHAPFILTEDRQHLLPGKKVNEVLVNALGELAADALPLLRDIGIEEGKTLIDENIYQFSYVREIYDEYEYRWNDNLIKPESLKIPCRTKMTEEPLLLSRSGKYLLPRQAFLYSPNKIADIIDPQQLRQLTGKEYFCDFVSPELNKLPTPYFWKKLKISTYGLSPLSIDITSEFMKSQSPAWVTKFFRFIVDDADKDYWKPDRDSPALLNAPIIKTTDGKWVAPFNNGSINVFYSSEESKGYNMVSDEMLSSPPIAKFLDEIGCKKPDEKDFILGKLLPKYEDEDNITDAIVAQDFLYIYDFTRKCDTDSREELIEKLSAALPIKCKSGDTELLLSANLIYYDSPELIEYFGWDDDAYFLDSACYSSVINRIGKEHFIDFIKELGIRFKPEIVEFSSNYSSTLTDFQKKQLGFDQIQKTWFRISENTFKGLDEVLKRPVSTILSKAIWKWLCESDLNDISKSTFNYQYYQYYIKKCDSCTIEKLRNTRWLFNSKGELKLPAEISIDEFSGLKYTDCNTLCKLLGIVSNRKTLADLGASKEQQDTYDFGKRMKDKMRAAGISESRIDELIREEETKKKAEAARKSKTSAEQPSDFLERKEMSQEGKEMFSGKEPEKPKENSKPNKPVDREVRREEAKKKIQEQHDKAIMDLERDTELAEMKAEISSPELKYTKKWFETLLKLEYLESPKNDITNSRTVSITFTTVRKEIGSERIIVLKNPSRSIPIELEDIGGLEVRFQFLDRDEFTKGFEVASVRDFTLRLKAPMSEADFLSEIDWTKCTRAFVDAHNPVELTGKFIDAFSNLYFEDDYYLEDEGDDEDRNPNLKELLSDKDNIRFIYGPPGTGKTTVLAEEIINLIQDGKNKWAKILVLAPTNRACDEVALKIREKVKNPDWAKRFVATDSEEIEELGMVCGRDSRLYKEDKCCIISTMARLPYDGFRNTDDGAVKLKDIAWDYVYIDEASMVSLAHSVFTIYQFPDSQIIFAGDPNQIPPIVHEEEWQDENIYTMVGLSSFDNPVTEPIQFEVKKLMTQYRSVPAIGEVFSRYSYDGKIIHNRETGDQQEIELSGYPIKTINLIPFRVERYDNIFGARKLAGSPVHLYSVILAVELCKYIAKEYNKTHEADLTVGIICPYASEAQMIDKLVEQQRDIPDNIKITVGTIHGFQGAQCDIVFVVFNPPTGLAGIKGEDMRRRIFLNRSNIINVGISRAKDYMFILLPHSDTAGYENLIEIDRLGNIIYSCAEDEVSNFTCDQVEKFIFGRKFFIENNMFATSHQLANVYTKPEKQYEIRIDDNAVDIQMGGPKI